MSILRRVCYPFRFWWAARRLRWKHGLMTPNGLTFRIRGWHDFVAIVETCLLKAYGDLPSGKVVDIGASIGDFALTAARSADHVWAYDIDTVPLTANAELNGIDNVTIVEARLLSLPEEPGRIDFLKIDCEGDEYRILAGCDLGRVGAIAMEYHEWDGRTVEELAVPLRESGFRVSHAANPWRPDIGYLFAQRQQQSELPLQQPPYFR